MTPNPSPLAYRPTEHVVATELSDSESVLLNLETRRYYTLNDTGTRIWQLIGEGAPVDRIAQALTTEWQVSHEEAMRAIEQLCSELLSEALIEPAEH